MSQSTQRRCVPVVPVQFDTDRLVINYAKIRDTPMKMSDLPGRLHRESRPLTWKEFTDAQRDAVRSLHELLQQIGEDVMQHEKIEHDPAPLVQLINIDRQRSNRIILIDGGRGTGKTSVLVSLVDRWARTIANGTAEPQDDDDSIRGALKVFAVLPTPIVDLQPLSENAHLMLHVCGHLKRLMSLLRHASSASAERDMPASEIKWEAFSHAAAKVWQPRNDRSSRLAPEDLAEELSDIEIERLGLADAFRQFVDALHLDLIKALNIARPVILAVPLDDADLNPWRALEALDLARWLYHPRVVFILAGDSATFQRVIHADALGNLRRPLRDIEITTVQLEALYGASKIEALAKDIFDKLIPPSHRIRIRNLNGEQRLSMNGVAPVLSTLAVTVDARTLQRLNAKIPSNLYEYLQAARLAAALPAELRRLHHLIEVVGADSRKPFSAGAARRFTLDLAQEAWLRSGLEEEGVRSISDDDLQSIVSKVKFKMARSPRIAFRRGGSTKDTSRFEIVSENVALSGQLEIDDEYHELSAQLTHCFLLVDDLRTQRRREPSHKSDTHVAVVCPSSDGARIVIWPGVAFRYHIEQRAFLYYVNTLLEDSNGDEESFVAWYMSVIIQLHEDGNLEIEKLGLHRVLSSAARLYRTGHSVKAAQIVEVAAPEFGISIQLATRWLDIAQEMFGADWPALREALVERRRRRFGRLEINTDDNHPWSVDIEGRVSPGIAMALGQLQNVGIVLPVRYRSKLQRIRHLHTGDIIPALRPKKRLEVRAQNIVVRLWSAINFRTKIADDLSVDIKDSGLVVSPVRDPWESIQVGIGPVNVTPVLALSHLSFESLTPVSPSQESFISPQALAVHELGSDIAVNTGTVRLESRQSASWVRWPGALLVVDSSATASLWPAPPFATFIEVAMLCSYWNEVVQVAVAEMSEEDHRALPSRIAYSFIESIVNVFALSAKSASTSASTPAPTSEPPGNTEKWSILSQRIDQMRQELSDNALHKDSVRAFLAWRRIWRVMAAPEFGLPPAISAVILMSRRAGAFSADERQTLRAARLELCKEAGVPLVDSRMGHPWMHHVEQPPPTRQEEA